MSDKKTQLLEWLQIALELELATIPPYLVALLSIKEHSNRAAAELIRSVVVEEMLHLALVANVTNAVGGAPRIDRSAVPQFPLQLKFEGRPFADRQFPVELARFSERAVETFMKIEMPHQIAVNRMARAAKIDVPALTIGDFYQNIVNLLTELHAAGGLFVDKPERQLGADYYWSGGGKIIHVKNLASAQEALSIVINQGEGTWPVSAADFAAAADEPFALGHYFRFREIYHKRYYNRKTDDPNGAPTGPPMTVDYEQVWPIRTNAKSSDYPTGSEVAKLNAAFNREYTLMLRQIGEAFNGQPNSLYTAIMNGMHQVSSIARRMMSLQIPGTTENACPTFEWGDL
jgi:hypothetical protein